MTQRDYEWRYKVRINLDGVVPFDALTPEQESHVVQGLTDDLKEMYEELQKVREISLVASTDTSLVSPILYKLCDSPLLAELDEVKYYKEKLALEADPGLIENALDFFLSTYAGIAQKLKADTERICSLKQELQQHESATGVARKEAPPTKRNDAPAEDVASKWEKLIQYHTVIADYSSLIHDERLFGYISPLLEKYDKKLNLPQATIFRIRQNIQESSGKEERQYLESCYQHLLELQQQGRLQVCGFSTAEGGDLKEEECKEIKDLAAQHRLTTRLLVLTQNYFLAEELMRLNNQQSARGERIKVKKLSNAAKPINLVKSPIYLAKKLRDGQDPPLPLTELPSVDSLVFTEHGPLQLQSKIGDGGEGSVYRTETSYVAKIYKPECCTAYRLEKLQKMLEANLKCEGICFPVELLKNSKGEFVGYLMEEAPAKHTLKDLTVPARVKRHFPDWTRLDVVQCSLEVLKKFQYLHRNNIVLGDINPKNILIADPEHVYFVDTDSYQINDLPCPVGMIDYTAPELHQMIREGKISTLSQVLRTKDHDNFAIATLLFQMMMVGMKPYTQQGGCNNGDSIIDMHFPYPCGEEGSENLPEGNWRFCWSHMDRKVKEAFKAVFDGSKRALDDPFNTKKRKDASEWHKVMEGYQKSLKMQWSELNKFCEEHGCTPEDVEALRVKGCDVDPQRFTLFPSRLKRVDKREYAKCKNCGKEFSVEKGKKVHDWCFDCYKTKPRSQKELICDDCGEHFFISSEKYDRLVSENKRPKRCNACKAKRKLQREAVLRPTGASAKPIPTQSRVQPSAPVATNPATPSAKTEDSKKKSLLSILFGW